MVKEGATEYGYRGLEELKEAKEKIAEGRLSRFGLDWAQAMKAKFARAAKKKAKPQKAIARASCKEPPNGYFFKYDKKMYQDVNKFCDHHEGMKNCSSKARKVVVNTDFPKSAYLVVPGHSTNNYRWIPTDWKTGVTDLSKKPDAAYLLENKEKPTGTHILLVSSEELKLAAARALFSFPQRKRKPEIEKTQSTQKKQATRQKLFSTEQVGICPDCGKATDVSKFTVDTRNRFRCPQQNCKKQKGLLRWHCSKCSSKGKAIAKGNLRICKSVKGLRNSVSDFYSN